MIALLISFFSSIVFACDFRPEYRSIYSLSGPVTQFLEHYRLLQKSQVKGISTFHPVADFKGQRLPGGIYLSQSLLHQLKGATLFYDESRELRRLLELHPEIKSIEVKTRGLTPLQVMIHIQSLISTLTQRCQFDAQGWVQGRLEYLKRLIPKSLAMIFFLGKITPPRFPELVIVNDGVVKWLKDESLIRTYPSDLAYVNWSAKIMSEVPSYLKVGIQDSTSSKSRSVSRSGDTINLTYPGALIPGIGQVEGMIYLFEKLPR